MVAEMAAELFLAGIAGQDVEIAVELNQRIPVSPGDNIRVPERFF